MLAILFAAQALTADPAEAGCKGRRKDRQVTCANPNYRTTFISGGTTSQVSFCEASYQTDFKPAYDELMQRLNEELAAAESQEAQAAIQARMNELNQSQATLVSDCEARQFMAYTRYKMKWVLPKCKKTPEYDNIEEAERLCQIDASGFDGDNPGTGGSPGGGIDADLNTFKGLDNDSDDNRSIIGDGDFNPLSVFGQNQSTAGVQGSAAKASGGANGPPGGGKGSKEGKNSDGSDGAGGADKGFLSGLMNALTGGRGTGSGSSGGSGIGGGLSGGGGASLAGADKDAGANGDGGGSGDGKDASGAGDGIYSMGGSGGRSPASGSGGADGTGGLFGAGGILGALGDKSGAGANGSGEIAFGQDPNAAAGAKGPRGSDDPSDYFNRIGIHENIFKKVERRYGEKAMNWYIDGARKK